jgi:hypothetical protein
VNSARVGDDLRAPVRPQSAGSFFLMGQLHAVDAHEATRTVLCKEPGCEEVADASRGPYALLCHRHAREKREQRLTAPAPRAPTPLRSGMPISFEARAKRLVAIGKNLDRKLDKLKPAQEEARAAMAEWKAATESLAQ